MNLDFREHIFKGGFRPTTDVDEFEPRLRAKLGLRTRYEYAGLCLGRSLAIATSPEPVQADVELGKPISGELLFGPELDLWIAVFAVDGDLGASARIDDFRSLVQAHWCRGARQLRDELAELGDDETRLMLRLADLLPESTMHRAANVGARRGTTGDVRLRIGSVSRTYPDDTEIDVSLNGQASAPHIALMGKVGSGKTTTGVQIAQQIAESADIPILFVDPKGEFVTDERLLGPLGAMSNRATAIEVGEHPIPLDFLPPAGVGTTTITQAAMQFRDSIALCCKSVGNLQQDELRKAVEAVIRSPGRRDLVAIRSRYEENLAQTGKQPDSVVSRLNELTALKVFEPSSPLKKVLDTSAIIATARRPGDGVGTARARAAG